ncbi:hypothetical protein GCM10028833_30120 [Glycomyces tarimensis]
MPLHRPIHRLMQRGGSFLARVVKARWKPYAIALVARLSTDRETGQCAGAARSLTAASAIVPILARVATIWQAGAGTIVP